MPPIPCPLQQLFLGRKGLNLHLPDRAFIPSRFRQLLPPPRLHSPLFFWFTVTRLEKRAGRKLEEKKHENCNFTKDTVILLFPFFLFIIRVFIARSNRLVRILERVQMKRVYMIFSKRIIIEKRIVLIELLVKKLEKIVWMFRRVSFSPLNDLSRSFVFSKLFYRLTLSSEEWRSFFLKLRRCLSPFPLFHRFKIDSKSGTVIPTRNKSLQSKKRSG